MQTGIRRQGPVKIMTGSITVRCMALVNGPPHSGVAIANANTWVVRSDLHPNLSARSHSCRNRGPTSCYTATELRAVDYFLRHSVNHNVHVSFQLTDFEAVTLMRQWRLAKSQQGAIIPRWYPSTGTALRRLARRVREQRRRIGVELLHDEHDELQDIGLRMAAVMNRALWQPSQQTTPFLDEHLTPVLAKLPH